MLQNLAQDQSTSDKLYPLASLDVVPWNTKSESIMYFKLILVSFPSKYLVSLIGSYRLTQKFIVNYAKKVCITQVHGFYSRNSLFMICILRHP